MYLHDVMHATKNQSVFMLPITKNVNKWFYCELIMWPVSN